MFGGAGAQSSVSGLERFLAEEMSPGKGPVGEEVAPGKVRVSSLASMLEEEEPVVRRRKPTLADNPLYKATLGAKRVAKARAPAAYSTILAPDGTVVGALGKTLSEKFSPLLLGKGGGTFRLPKYQDKDKQAPFPTIVQGHFDLMEVWMGFYHRIKVPYAIPDGWDDPLIPYSEYPLLPKEARWGARVAAVDLLVLEILAIALRIERFPIVLSHLSGDYLVETASEPGGRAEIRELYGVDFDAPEHHFSKKERRAIKKEWAWTAG